MRAVRATGVFAASRAAVRFITPPEFAGVTGDVRPVQSRCAVPGSSDPHPTDQTDTSTSRLSLWSEGSWEGVRFRTRRIPEGSDTRANELPEHTSNGLIVRP